MRVARRLAGDLQRHAALAPRRSKVRRVWSEGSKPQREGRIPERAQTSGGIRGIAGRRLLRSRSPKDAQ